MLTTQDIIERCETNCNGFEMLSKHYEDYSFENNKDYQECYLVKQYLKELLMIKEILKHDKIYVLRTKCEGGMQDCPAGTTCRECSLDFEYMVKMHFIDNDIIRMILDVKDESWIFNETCFLNESDANKAAEKLNKGRFDYNCSKCGHKFLESESYKWRINNRIIDCCPKCKQPIMYARENK